MSLRTVVPEPLATFLASPRLATALSTAGIGLAATTFLSQRILGWPALIAALAVLLVLMTGSLVARWSQLEWRALPISLVVFLGWSTVSLIWSEYQWATVGGLAYLFAFSLVGVFIALSRDTIQIVRATGDVLRVVLGVSLGIEIVAGVLIDTPVEFLNIDALIADLGPIAGVAGTRNQLGVLAIVGALSFATEYRTRSVRRGTAIASLALAVLCAALTRSSVILLASVLVIAAAAIIYGIRRVPAERRQYWQFTVLGLAIIGIAVGWVLRARLVDLFNAGGELDYRLRLWGQVSSLVARNSLEGWGWIGHWHTDVVPFAGLQTTPDRQASSALNAYLDVWLQVGLVGLVIFVGMVGLAFVRSWLLAGRRRSVVYAWPAAVLVALLVTALAESSLLIEFGWVIFVVCCLKASQELSWRTALRSRGDSATDEERTTPEP